MTAVEDPAVDLWRDTWHTRLMCAMNDCRAGLSNLYKSSVCTWGIEVEPHIRAVGQCSLGHVQLVTLSFGFVGGIEVATLALVHPDTGRRGRLIERNAAMVAYTLAISCGTGTPQIPMTGRGGLRSQFRSWDWALLVASVEWAAASCLVQVDRGGDGRDYVSWHRPNKRSTS